MLKIIRGAKGFWKTLKETYFSYSSTNTWILGAGLSYYTLFSFAPIILILVTIAGNIFGKDAVQGRIYGEVQEYLGPEGAEQVQALVAAAYDPGKRWYATVIAIGLLIFGATTTLYQLQYALNTIWEVKPKPKRGFVKYLRDRILSLGLIAAVGLLLLISLLINTGITAFSEWLNAQFVVPVIAFKVIDALISLAIVTTLFAMIFKFLPDAKIRWRDVGVGAFVTAVLFNIGRIAIGYYLGKSNPASAYGAAGTIVLLLLWVNYSAQIFFFGAEFTQVYSKNYGKVIRPTEYAVRVKTVEVEQQTYESEEQFERKVDKVEETTPGAKTRETKVKEKEEGVEDV